MARNGAFRDLDVAFRLPSRQIQRCFRRRYDRFELRKIPLQRPVLPMLVATPTTFRSALDAVELMNVGANYLREACHQRRAHPLTPSWKAAPPQHRSR